MPVVPNQPTRPRLHPVTGKLLRYATFPRYNPNGKAFHVCTVNSRKAQCRLYRAVRQGHVPIQVAVADLYEFAFFGSNVSKVQMGYNAVRSVLYEPRLLVNNKSFGKATMTYTFATDLDFQYGLEWQICTWLGKFLDRGAPPEDLIGTEEQMAQELDDLGNSDLSTYIDIYESKFADFDIEEPRFGRDLVEELPTVEQMQMVQPPPPRRFDK